MAIFKNQNSKLAAIKELKFDLEKDLQKLSEANLKELFGLEFVATEFQLENYYLDTLAFDPETNAFVIIEYKRDKSFSVVDQGMHYLSLMFAHKADCLLELSQLRGSFVDKKTIDWSQSRVMFVARSFTPYQMGSIGFKDFPIELWQATMYENSLIDFTQVQAPKTGESITKITRSKEVAKVAEQVEEYDISQHRNKGSEKVQELFDELRERILELDSRIIEKPVKHYIAYKTHGTNVTSLAVYKDKIQVGIRTNKPASKRLDIVATRKRAWDTTPLWQFNVYELDQVADAMDHIKQAYKYYETRYS